MAYNSQEKIKSEGEKYVSSGSTMILFSKKCCNDVSKMRQLIHRLEDEVDIALTRETEGEEEYRHALWYVRLKVAWLEQKLEGELERRKIFE